MKVIKGTASTHVDTYIYTCQGKDNTLLTLSREFHVLDLTILAGFKWDGASSPNLAFFRWIAPKFYKNIKASCYHDAACSIAKNKAERKRADLAYRYLLQEHEKAGKIRSNLSYLGVRIGAAFGIGSNF